MEPRTGPTVDEALPRSFSPGLTGSHRDSRVLGGLLGVERCRSAVVGWLPDAAMRAVEAEAKCGP